MARYRNRALLRPPTYRFPHSLRGVPQLSNGLLHSQTTSIQHVSIDHRRLHIFVT